MKKIESNNVVFIKLGQKGKFEKDCIEKGNCLRLSYRKVNHDLCINGKWNLVHKYFIDEEKTNQGVATRHTNQIKQFYESNENTLWITFFKNKLWWCFSKPEIKLQDDGTKIRPVIGKWSDKDIKGNILFNGSLSGKLLKTQSYQGTICNIIEDEYTLNKINAQQSLEVLEVENALNLLRIKLQDLIENLQWQDFETLIDLIFRQAGWQRNSEIGKTTKTIDLELLSPVTGERAIVQIKSISNLKEFNKYKSEFNQKDYDKSFFVVNKLDKSLLEYKNNTGIILYSGKEISNLTINSGLIDWVINRTS